MKKEYIFLILSVFLFSSINPVGKLLLNEISPLQFSLIRSGFGFVIVSIGFLLSGEWRTIKKMDKKSFFLCIIFGTIAFFIFQILFASALINNLASINSILVNSIIPISVFVLTAIISHKKITIKSILGIILGIFGITLVVFKPESLSFVNSVGVIFAVLSGICWGISTFGMAEIRKKYGTFSITMISILTGAFISFLFVLFSNGFNEFINSSMNTKLLSLYAGFFATGLPVLLYYYCLKQLGAAKVSVSYYLGPIFGVILSAIILKEPIPPLLIVGTSFVLLGIWLVQKEKF